jgi:hypothetical protein
VRGELREEAVGQRAHALVLVRIVDGGLIVRIGFDPGSGRSFRAGCVVVGVALGAFCFGLVLGLDVSALYVEKAPARAISSGS